MTRLNAANEVRMRKVDQRYATRLRSRGWVVVDPADLDTVVRIFRELADDGPAEPCADGCANPAIHAEGGHDV